MQAYAVDKPAHHFLITATIMPEIYLTTLKYILSLSPAMLDYDQKDGFKLLSEWIDSDFQEVMKDLFEDPDGEYFVTDNQYADIALYLMHYMTEGPGFVTLNLTSEK